MRDLDDNALAGRRHVKGLRTVQIEKPQVWSTGRWVGKISGRVITRHASIDKSQCTNSAYLR